uniref:RING-type E3 ubiquitin transferase n=1 Tax=Platynereis dumerilii TaxID=6359 RepID=A0A8E7IXS8_PLADU|nr:UHRF1/2 [Platynereis dumerilii]
MWIQVRSMDGKKSVRIDNLSKLTKIEDLREILVEHFEAEPKCQRLFYRGKQLVDDHTLFDYNVGLNEIVQILIQKPPPKVETTKTEEKDEKENVDSDKENEEPKNAPQPSSTSEDCKDSTYKVGDIIDLRDDTMGAWFEASIIKVSKSTTTGSASKEKTESSSVLRESTPDVNQNQVEKEKESNDVEMKDESENENSKSENSSSENPKWSCPWEKYSIKDDGCTYHMVWEGEDESEESLTVKSNCIRPRARQKIKFDKIKEGDEVMVNFNYDEPDQRGYWYDAVVTGKKSTRTIKELICTVFIGQDLVPMENCKIQFSDEIFALEKPGDQFNMHDPENSDKSPVKRTNKPECDHCLDNPRRKCKFCACYNCAKKENPDKTLLCDECDMPYHIYCLKPPMESVPDIDEWYCPECKNDDTEVVKAGEKLKESKKKAKMASATNKTNRDWGKGMACVGRTKTCSIVPSNHFGPIPGVEVGTMWKFRVQASEAGVHRPHVAGIAGRSEEGAYSIVLSGGYEDDVDEGDHFMYTGSGGRDLSGNKRTADQSCDQTLTRYNMALARNCHAKLNPKDGATAEDWKKGKPVRVVRNCKGRKHSEYAPEEGNRYDGIYKLLKYYPEKGKSGFIVWRYEFQRDDPTPAPWTKAGKKRMEELGLEMQYPEGYLEAQAEKEKEKEKGTPGKGTPKGEKGKRKRKVIESDDEEEEDKEKEEDVENNNNNKSAKKPKVSYKVPTESADLIKKDDKNRKLWDEAMEATCEGAQKFLAKVEELFACICCQDIVFKPVTTDCAHNICKSCLSRSFKAEVYSCPTCRAELGENYKMPINTTLEKVLLKMFPGYENGR